jgi:tRNA threonylcarbamoyladenosine biosynthesis protein TsaE
MAWPSELSAWTNGLTTYSGEETERRAYELAACLPANTVLTLSGDLGTGKTTFTRGLVRGLGVTGDITSPSFALLNTYQGARQILHVDAYRLKDPAGFDDLLIWDLVTPPWNLIVEWPERVASKLPPDVWAMKIKVVANQGHHFVLQLPTQA